MQVKARLQSQHRLWTMLTEDNGRFLGWVTADDLQQSKSIRDIMLPPTVTAVPDTPLNEALSMMLNSAIGTLAVLDEEEKMVGVLSFQIIREVLGEQTTNEVEEAA